MTDDSLASRLARVLSRCGVDTMFGLPGGGPNLDVIGAGLDVGIRFILGHGETTTAIMAATYGRLTGKPTPVVVTRGPGAASAANGVAQATLDRFPLVLVSDSVPSAQAQRVPHQRLDQRALMAPLAKISATVSDATAEEDLVELVCQAVAWPSGAVHLDFDRTAVSNGSAVGEPPRALVDLAALERARKLVAEARRPLVIVGMEAAVWSATDGADVGGALARFGCPVLTTYQAIGVVPTEGELHAGLFTNGALERPLLDQADLVIALGLDEVEPIPAPWSISAPVVRLSTVAQESPYFDPAVDVVATVQDALGVLEPMDREWSAQAAPDFRANGRAALAANGKVGFGPLELVAAAAAAAPADVTTTVDAGAHFLAVMPNWPVSGPFGLLISNGLATMGFALPAAIGAALARPNRPVLAFTGDGGLSMVLSELETVARLDLPITVVVFNDAALSLIEIKQQPGHGGESTVRYHPVDFAAIARASGLHGVAVSSAEELRTVLDQGWDRPRLIDARIDPSVYRHLISVTRG